MILQWVHCVKLTQIVVEDTVELESRIYISYQMQGDEKFIRPHAGIIRRNTFVLTGRYKSQVKQ